MVHSEKQAESLESHDVKFSVVVPLYNKRDLITQTIDSVIRQRHQGWELIVVDDGSTDGSADLVKQYQDTRIKLHRQNNSGVSTARNFGVDKSSYDFIAFLDADDFWDEEYLTTIAKTIRQFPTFGVYGANYRRQVHGSPPRSQEFPGIRNIRAPQELKNYFSSAHGNSPLFTSAVVVRRGAFKDTGGFRPDLNLGEDLDLWCRLALSHRIAYTNIPLVRYNEGIAGSLSSGTKPAHYPFLEEYLPSPAQLVEEASVIEYITIRQLAIVAGHIALGEKDSARRALNTLRSPAVAPMKLRYYRALSLLPPRIGRFVLHWQVASSAKLSLIKTNPPERLR